MIYLVYGSEQDLLVNKEVKRILKNENKNDSEFSTTTYSLLETSIDAVINDCATMSIFDPRKTIIVKDCYIFQSAQSRPKVKIEHDIDKLKNYLSNPSEFTTLIFVVKGNIDEKLELVKRLKDVSKISKIVDLEKEEWSGVIGQLLDQYQIKMDNDAKQEFVNRTQGNLTIVINELKKLKALNSHITKDIVINLVARPLEDNMLGMMDAILDFNYNEAFKIFYDLKKKQEEPVRFISALATQLKFVYQVAVLSDEGYSNNDIANKFASNVKPGRIYYTLKKVKDGTKEQIISLLDKLATLDKQIKMGKVDKYDGFELFLSTLEKEN